MSKHKNFRDWVENFDDVEPDDKDFQFAKKDAKRYDKKKANIQRARKQKSKQKDLYFS